MDSMESDIRGGNSALAGELGPLATQKAEPVLRQGRDLANRLANDPAAHTIRQKTAQVNNNFSTYFLCGRSKICWKPSA